MITITRENNMDLMARYPDKYFELAIVDPPYGILNKTKRGGDHKFNMSEYSIWDKKPDDSYFKELFRVSKNQIVWGGNYFGQLWTKSEYNRGFIIWDKNQPESLNNFSMAEIAWSSFDKPSKIFNFSVRRNKNKIHPTQKPVELYDWLLKLYANPGDRILDTHLGSGTIAIACYKAGFSLTACELSENYFSKAIEKIKEFIPETAIKCSNDSFSLLAPSKMKSEDPLFNKYLEHEEQLKLFKESRKKYDLLIAASA